MNGFNKNIILFLALISIGVAIWYLGKIKEQPAAVKNEEAKEIKIAPARESDAVRIAKKEKIYERAKEITTPDGFINTDGISISDLIGKKVILLDIWTYSCINCQRTLPYVKSWWDKYKDQGLEIIGLHTPEFDFEKKYENVLAAVKKFGIAYPVVLDNDYSTWQAYKNQYWPRKYLIDIDGFVVYDHIGEGGYAVTENQIQEALKERMAVLNVDGNLAKNLEKIPVVSESKEVRVGSPETYFGAFRNEYLGNGTKKSVGMQSFVAPAEAKINTLYLVGDWDIQNEFAENKSKAAKIIFRYQSKEVYFVASSDAGATIKILRDGKPLSAEAGADIQKDGSSTAFIKNDQLYKLIQDSSYGEHTLEIIIENPGLRAFTFTFG